MIRKIPIVGPLARRLYRAYIHPARTFESSDSYWKARYIAGGNSGPGSFDRLAEFKAEMVNTFVMENRIASVIEYGCGDGNQLSLAKYPKYIGFDVSPDAIAKCSKRFANDETKTFKLMEYYEGETAELTLSLDVIYHLVEDVVFIEYVERLFDSSERFVVIYSSDSDENPKDAPPHIRHRKFSKWVADNKVEWTLLNHIPNRYPVIGNSKSGSFSDFYIYVRR